jgi:hypothetical protein
MCRMQDVQHARTKEGRELVPLMLHGIRKLGGWQVSRGGSLQAECIIAIQLHKKLDACKPTFWQVDTWLNTRRKTCHVKEEDTTN